ncbi:MAG: type II toxin-antitoxin system death-on-curing family toxin [Phycisphaerae bacterium]|jgi:death-on-curing protein|nr:type II toxin-antitoxin system death-on-curing family toxin [Phycisphaerae bacterium]HCT45249.1 type II toxin-antitoxin system death-on-curing family toxin [Phycisphaerales bacterium]|tara:strand:+ start:1387 stop:1794 length:408 start_codon:yes stop_codon:yes gene_type:complete
MPEIVFLSPEDVIQIHRDQIEKYGGSPEVRDSGLLASAISTPESSFQGEYLHPSLPAMGAAYMFHLIQNHPFIDGNKRTGSMCALIFLNQNWAHLQVTVDQLGEMAFGIARSDLSKDQVIEIFEQHVEPYDSSDD